MGQGFAGQRLGVNIAAGTGLAQTGTVVFSNANNISFGMVLSASSLVITAQGGGVAIGDGLNNITSGTAIFIDTNGISQGVTGQSVTAVYGIIAGTANTFATGGSGVKLADANGHQFSVTNTSQIVVNHTNVKFFDSPGERNVAIAFVTTGSLSSIQRFSLPFPMAVTQIDVVRHLTVPGSTGNSYSFQYGIYSFSGSTASLMTDSGGNTYSFALNVTFNSGTNSTAASIYGGNSGTRFRSASIPLLTMILPAGEYLFGFGGAFTGVVGSTGSITMFGRSSNSIVGAIGGGNYSAYFGDGVFSTNAALMPSSIHLSAITQTGVSALGQPYFRLIGT